jgi:hypothetical protein
VTIIVTLTDEEIDAHGDDECLHCHLVRAFLKWQKAHPDAQVEQVLAGHAQALTEVADAEGIDEDELHACVGAFAKLAATKSAALDDSFDDDKPLH